MTSRANKVLVIAAHPDDEVLGCGATIAKHSQIKDQVWVLILGEGITSRKNLKESQKNNLLKRLNGDAQKADKILGVSRLILEHFADNKFDSVPLLEIIHKIEAVIDDCQPQMIYTHSKADVNIDHRRTLEAVEAVIRPQPGSKIGQVLSFEIPSSTDWNFVRNTFTPNHFVSIEEKFLNRKIKALQAYHSEIRLFPHPRSIKYLQALATIRGGQAGYNLAEAFEVILQRKIDL